MTEDTSAVVAMAKDRLKNNQQRSARLRKENLLWGQNDARIQILDRLWHVTMAAMACYVAQRDHFSSREWWKNHVGFRVKEDAGYSWNRTIESFVKFGWIVLSFSMLETAFRNMLYAIEGKKPSNEFYKVYKQLLDATAVNPSDEQKSAVRLFQLTRNTVHDNGIYNGSKEEVVTFGGAGFLFKPGYKV